ncbi:MAG: N-formylglutamate amidohydrolase [Alphaproteobacteria bacterium]|nr:MAG: N-formylglutamate amidohydrolase [Alphaproteobacteria bacterium]
MTPLSDPVKILMPEEWRIPFVYSSPHSGRIYPDNFVESSNLDFLKLRQSEDFLVDLLFESAPEAGAPLLRAEFPRAYCDANREAFELDPRMFTTPLPDYVMTASPRLASGIGTIPRVVGAGQEIYADKLEFEEAQRRINNCYFPYHHALRQLLEEGLKRFGVIYLIDCHSMPSGPCKGPRGPKRPEIVLGNRYGISCGQSFFSAARDCLKDLGYRIGENSPYAGGFITTHYGRPDKNIHALQIELCRSLYMDQKTLEPIDNFTVLQNDLRKFIHDTGRARKSLLSA